MNCGPDLATLHRRIAWSGVAGNEQDEALARGHCALEASIDCAPCLVERQPMEIDDAVGLN